MQAPDDGAGGAAGGAGSPCGPREPGDPGDTAALGTVAGEACQAEGASPAPGHSEGPSALASGEASEEKEVLEFALTVPFLCYMDAELAYQYLTLSAEFSHEAVQSEFRVVGSDLLIRLTAEDPVLLHISTASMLNQLSLVVQIMQHFVPVFLLRPQPGKRG